MIIVIKLIPYNETSHEHLNSITTSSFPSDIILAILIKETSESYS